MYYRDIRVDECNDDWKKLANMDDTKQEFIYPPLGIKVFKLEKYLNKK